MQLCSDEKLNQLVEDLQSGEPNGVERLSSLLQSYPDDPRIVFMMASMLASQGDLVNAHKYFGRAIEIAPDLHIAGFQFGLFQLTSGESNAALKTWALLDTLPEGHYLKLFATGLRHLIRDEFDDCVRLLQEGISVNDENLPLNGDMQMLIDRCRDQLAVAPENAVAEETSEEQSATSILLKQFGDGRTTRH